MTTAADMFREHGERLDNVEDAATEALHRIVSLEESAPDRELHLTERLAIVMGAASRVAKTEKHPHHGYMFAGVEAIVAEVNQSLAEQRVILVPRQLKYVVDAQGTKQTRTTVWMEYTFQWRSQTVGPIPWVAWADDTQDKGMAKALTASRKTFLRDFFLITIGDERDLDPDRNADSGSYQRGDQAEHDPPDEEVLSPANQKLLMDEAQMVGLDANGESILIRWVTDATHAGYRDFPVKYAGRLRSLHRRFDEDPVKVASGVVAELSAEGGHGYAHEPNGRQVQDPDAFLALANAKAEAKPADDASSVGVDGTPAATEGDGQGEQAAPAAPAETPQAPQAPQAPVGPSELVKARTAAIRLKAERAGLVTRSGRASKRLLDVVLAVASPEKGIPEMGEEEENDVFEALEYVYAASVGERYEGPLADNADGDPPYVDEEDVQHEETLIAVLGDWRTYHETVSVTDNEGGTDDEV